MNYALEALAGLSLQHPKGRTPAAPSNEDRLRAFRACVRPEIGNTRLWQWVLATEYAQEAIADSEPSTDIHPSGSF